MLRPYYSPPMQCNANEASIPATPVYDPSTTRHQTKGQYVIVGQSYKAIKQSNINTNTYTSVPNIKYNKANLLDNIMLYSNIG